MFKFQMKYFILTIILFFSEIIITLFFHDRFVRPYFGDFLVVILIYCFFKSFLKISVLKLSFSVLLFSYLIEMLQFFNYVKFLGLQNSRFANIILGNSFAWTDILAYTIGIWIVILTEYLFILKQK
jgi:hypothetical protein